MAAGLPAVRWGWHPLVDSWARRVVKAAEVRAGELVLDVGAGEGALTRHLVAAGASVIAVELHPGRVATLRRRFAGQDVRVVEADLRALYLPRRPFRVVANPPFAMTASLLRLLLGRESRLTQADLVLQRAVVSRYCAAGARRFALDRGLVLPRQAFRPPPVVDAAVLTVRRVRG